MKKCFLYLGLVLAVLALGASPSFAANKKYRYIKREHGVRFQGGIPMSFGAGSFSLNADFKGAYAYNWKGLVEVGPYFDVSAGFSQTFSLDSWSAGLLGEYNFIKNRGKRKMIPSAGIKIGADKNYDGLALGAGAHASFKYFVAKRTAFISTVAYRLNTPMTAFFSSLSHNVDINMGFSYYFDFY